MPGALYPSGGSRTLWRGLGEAWAVLGYLVSGIAFWGGAGFGLDHLLGTDPVFLVAGVLLGNFAGVYLIYLRWPTREREDHRAS